MVTQIQPVARLQRMDEQRQLVELCEKGILRLQALQKEILGL